MVATHISVIAALRDSGLRKAWMPFEIASTPLRATAPDENARMSRNVETPPSTAVAPVKWCRARWSTGSGPRSPVASWTSPHTTRSVMIAM